MKSIKLLPILWLFVCSNAYALNGNLKESWNCFNQSTLDGALPVIVGDFWDFRSGHNSAYEFPGFTDENGELQKVGIKKFFLTYLYTIDNCSFKTNHKYKLVAFEDGEVILTESYNHRQDNATKPVQGIRLGYIENPPQHGTRDGRNEIGRLIREVIITQDLSFSFQVSKKRRIVGAYGIPLGISTSCEYEMTITDRFEQTLDIFSTGHYGRPDGERAKRCL